LPLTLTLSPQAGRGDLPHEGVLLEENGPAYPFAPLAGRATVFVVKRFSMVYRRG
jgi:hypothetical protein